MTFAALDSCEQPPVEGTPFHEWTSPGGQLWTAFHRIDGGYFLRFPALADFRVSADGRSVSGYPAPGVSGETFRHLFLNQVLPLALSRLRKLVFHASAVEIGARAIAFVGESGRGKSTLAASFAGQGHRFLSDDVLVVEARDGAFVVQPSHPSIRLWEDSQEALARPGAAAYQPLQFTTKARLRADDTMAFCDEPRQLHRVYFLGQGGSQGATFERMAPSEALIELVKHSFMLDIEARDLLASHFDQLSRLVRLPIYYRLDYTRRFEALGDVRRAILRQSGDCSDIDVPSQR